MPNVKLQSSDGVIIEVDEEIAKCSVTIKTMLENSGPEAVICLPEVSSAVLRKVIEWATYHKDDPPQLEEPGNYISPWDADFLNGDEDTIFNLSSAALYLEMKALLQLTTKAIIQIINNRLSH